MGGLNFDVQELVASHTITADATYGPWRTDGRYTAGHLRLHLTALGTSQTVDLFTQAVLADESRYDIDNIGSAYATAISRFIVIGSTVGSTQTHDILEAPLPMVWGVKVEVFNTNNATFSIDFIPIVPSSVQT